MSTESHSAPADLAADDLLEQIYRLRYDIWQAVAPRVVAPYPDERMADPEDSTAAHFFAAVGGRVVAAARVTVVADLADLPPPFADWFREHHGRYPEGVSVLGRLVCAPAWRGRGLARALDCARLAHIAEHGPAIATAMTRGFRIGSLARLGFVRATSRGPFSCAYGEDALPLMRACAPAPSMPPTALPIARLELTRSVPIVSAIGPVDRRPTGGPDPR